MDLLATNVLDLSIVGGGGVWVGDAVAACNESTEAIENIQISLFILAGSHEQNTKRVKNTKSALAFSSSPNEGEDTDGKLT